MKTTALLLFMAVFMAAPVLSMAQTNPVPKGYKLKKEEDYKKYEADVLKCIEWYDNTPLNKYPAIRKEVEAFLMAWHQGSPTVTIVFGEMAVKCVEENPTLLLTYMNGWTKFVLQGGDDEANTAGALLAALEHTITTYSNPSIGFEKSKQLDKLQKARDKGTLKGMAEKEASQYVKK